MKNKTIILVQIVFLSLIGVAIFVMYPKVNLEVSGNLVRFDSINAEVIMISKNSDFSNPRFLDLREIKNISFELEPGTYYWKSDNGFIQGFKNSFVIDSEVGLGINKTFEKTNLVNIGNIKLNVTKDGFLTGEIVLEPGESEEIKEDNVTYFGRQND